MSDQTPLEYRDITPQCRINRTVQGAWQEACEQLEPVFQIGQARRNQSTFRLALIRLDPAPVVAVPEAGEGDGLPVGALEESLRAAIASGSAPSGFAVNDDGTAAETHPGQIVGWGAVHPGSEDDCSICAPVVGEREEKP